MLGRLVQRGALIAEGDGRRRRYSASERLYTIYYKLRRERDEAAVVSSLIRFMVMFYSESELTGMSDTLSRDAAHSPAIREGIERALIEAQNSGNFMSREELSILREVHVQAIRLNHLREAKDLGNELIRALEEEEDSERIIMIADRFLGSPADEASRSSTILADLMTSSKLLAQAEIGSPPSAISFYEEVVERFSASDDLALKTAVAMALLKKGNVHGRVGDPHAAIATYGELVKRYGASDSLALQLRVAKSLFNIAITYRQIDDSDAEVATYGEVVKLGDIAGEIAAYEQIIRRYGGSDSPDLRVQVAAALVNKACIHIGSDHMREALHTCEALERYRSLTDPRDIAFGWWAAWLKTKAVLRLVRTRSGHGGVSLRVRRISYQRCIHA